MAVEERVGQVLSTREEDGKDDALVEALNGDDIGRVGRPLCDAGH